jgi:enoyl-CoA hydratase/carnithine racemase
MIDEAWTKQHLIYERMVRAILGCPIPIIAAVNGAAYAGGCELALACDFIYAAEHSRFALTEVTLGIMPGAGGTQTLARAAGERRAKEIIFAGKPFTAAEALQWGLVNRVLSRTELLLEALSGLAAAIATGRPKKTKRRIRTGFRFSKVSLRPSARRQEALSRGCFRSCRMMGRADARAQTLRPCQQRCSTIFSVHSCQ